MCNPNYNWLTTAPSGRAHTHGADGGQVGWRLHAVLSEDTQTFAEIKGTRALCGLKPRIDWGLDLFIIRRCRRCLAKVREFDPDTPDEGI